MEDKEKKLDKKEDVKKENVVDEKKEDVKETKKEDKKFDKVDKKSKKEKKTTKNENKTDKKSNTPMIIGIVVVVILILVILGYAIINEASAFPKSIISKASFSTLIYLIPSCVICSSSVKPSSFVRITLCNTVKSSVFKTSGT